LRSALLVGKLRQDGCTLRLLLSAHTHADANVLLRPSAETSLKAPNGAMDDYRKSLLVKEALVFAIEGFSQIPIPFRPESDIRDLQTILLGLVQEDVSLASLQKQARDRLDRIKAAPRPKSG
jgi:hypothetical protein